jgi:cytochrome b561
MTISNTPLRYGTVAMTLHWLIAALVVVNIGLGLWFAMFMAHHDPMHAVVAPLHKSIGLTVLVLSLLRVVWRLINPVPPLPAAMSPALKATARVTQFLLYFLILALPLSGWAFVSSLPHGQPTMYFGLFAWPAFPLPAELSRATIHMFGSIHVYLAWTAIVLVPIHVAGALHHQFLRRDDVLKRMVPGTAI